MTSIIGYTRVPFNSSSSKHFTIVPVKQLYQNKISSHQDQQQNPFIFNKIGYNDSKTNAKQPTYHRIFSREMNQHGIIELIIDKKTMTNRTISNTQDSKIVHKRINDTPTHYQHNEKPTKYNVLLSIDLSDSHDYDNLSIINGDSSYGNLQRFIDSLSKMAQEKSFHFVKILNFLQKLQSQKEHQFMSCIDRQNEKVLVYFPSTISSSVDQTYRWLKYTIGIDVNKFKKWNLSPAEETQLDDEVTGDDSFDGESYFKDIHMFIDHVDSLIESNGLFSHHQNQEPIT